MSAARPTVPLATSSGLLRSTTVTCFGRALTLRVDDASLDHALVVWDASVALVRFLEASPRDLAPFLRGARVLELGAGTGLLGLALAHAGARVVLTDLPHVAAGNLAANVAAEALPPGAPGSARALPLPWGDAGALAAALAASPGGAFDAVVATDVAYSEALNPALLETAAAAARASEAAGARCTLLFANELRCELAQAVFDRVAPTLFAAKRVRERDLPAAARGMNMILYRMRLKTAGRRRGAGGEGGGGGGDGGGGGARAGGESGDDDAGSGDA